MKKLPDDLEKVYLYYPNKWKKYVSLPSEGGFNWFICSKRYLDDKNRHIIEVAPKTRFFSIDNGKSFSINKHAKLFYVNDNKVKWEMVKNEYDGLVYKKCDQNNKNHLLCENIIFAFKKGLLETTDIDLCDIIVYSKSNNKCIRDKIADFPTCEEIDEVLKKYDCSLVSKILYEYIVKFMK